jgi:hypothetical protein
MKREFQFLLRPVTNVSCFIGANKWQCLREVLRGFIPLFTPRNLLRVGERQDKKTGSQCMQMALSLVRSLWRECEDSLAICIEPGDWLIYPSCYITANCEWVGYRESVHTPTVLVYVTAHMVPHSLHGDAVKVSKAIPVTGRGGL